MDQLDLFDVGPRPSPPLPAGRTCTPMLVGSGPSGERCGTCRYLERIQMAKVYLKCGLMKQHWTGGAATDIKAKWTACGKWEAIANTEGQSEAAAGGNADG